MDQQTLVARVAARKGPDVSEAAFARRLAIPRGLWNDTVAGRKNVSDALLAGIAGAFPEMDPDVCDFLRARYAQRKARAEQAPSQGARAAVDRIA